MICTAHHITLTTIFVKNMPSNAARHPLVKDGHVRPVMLQPLFKEIDERDFGGKEFFRPFLKYNLG